MKKVIEEFGIRTHLSETSLPRIDFTDTFSTTNHHDDLITIAHKVFNQSPIWIKGLFALRHFLVKLVGIKSQLPADFNTEKRVGGYIGFFKIFALGENEIILGLDDEHLNFRVSIFNSNDQAYNIKVITCVEFNNSKGRFYMQTIKPFHRFVVMSMVANAYR
ncbi:DUF2867 domain-containing protein [Bacteriovorax sp. DB6_IX]|uniref:DUF2867 domain-containing protein n=1 Tax=Bacteriovorax sp. DB6_IX TaxID=1353530 RepID=UPI0012F81388|nr:DUF2867 domain-containing protein [Bacteriovorax sp. DB6_IX]